MGGLWKGPSRGEANRTGGEQDFHRNVPTGIHMEANPLRPHDEEGGSNELGHGQIIDFVKVNDNIWVICPQFCVEHVLLGVDL